MVSNSKHYISESTTDEEPGDMEYLPHNQVKPARKPTRTPKCFSKNALMARENRLKKKMYISNLEEKVASLKNDNKKLTQIVDNQSLVISELKREVKYFQSVLANSEAIGKLICAINSSTGMAVTTSVEKKPTLKSLNNKNVTRAMVSEAVVSQNNSSSYNSSYDLGRHPWEEAKPGSPYVNYPTPESITSCYGSPEFEELNNEGLLLDMDIPIEMNNDELLNMIDEKALESPIIPIEDHNYHNPIKTEHEVKVKEEEVGVCLHVSNNKVSLEFCPSCSDHASLSWRTS